MQEIDGDVNHLEDCARDKEGGESDKDSLKKNKKWQRFKISLNSPKRCFT